MAMVPVTWALYEARDVTPSEKVVLIVLADHAAPNGTGAFPSWARIAAASGVSRRTVARVLDALEVRGLIRRGDQEIAAERLRSAGKDVRYAPVVWDLVMDGSHSAQTQNGLPPVVDTNHSLGEGAGQQGCQSGTSGRSVHEQVAKGCHPDPSRGATAGTQNQEQDNNNQPPGEVAGSARQRLTGAHFNVDPGALAQAVMEGLPSTLVEQMVFAVLAGRCSRLVDGGWTTSEMKALTTKRSWAGAGPGAVISWIDSLRSPSRTAGSGKPNQARSAKRRSERELSRAEREVQGTPRMVAIRQEALSEIRQILEDKKRSATNPIGGQ